jgi:hypothetical protein
MENRIRRNLAAGVISPLLLLSTSLVAAEPSLHIEAADGILRCWRRTAVPEAGREER